MTDDFFQFLTPRRKGAKGIASGFIGGWLSFPEVERQVEG
jgi:hypothetical protein